MQDCFVLNKELIHMKTSKTALTCRFFPIDAVSVTHLRDMYQVFSRYYANTDLETFVNDMSRKSGVFLLREKKGQRIVGFSTWTEVPLQDRKSTRLNSSHVKISYAVFCLK